MSNYMKFCKRCALSYSKGVTCRTCGGRLRESSVDEITWDNFCEKDKQNFFVNLCGKEGRDGDKLTQMEVQEMADQISLEDRRIAEEKKEKETIPISKLKNEKGIDVLPEWLVLSVLFVLPLLLVAVFVTIPSGGNYDMIIKWIAIPYFALLLGGTIYYWFYLLIGQFVGYTKQIPGTMPQKNAVMAGESRFVVGAKGGKKYKSLVYFSDGFVYISYSTGTDYTGYGYKIYIDDEISEEISKKAKKAHEKALLKLQKK